MRKISSTLSFPKTFAMRIRGQEQTWPLFLPFSYRKGEKNASKLFFSAGYQHLRRDAKGGDHPMVFQLPTVQIEKTDQSDGTAATHPIGPYSKNRCPHSGNEPGRHRDPLSETDQTDLASAVQDSIGLEKKGSGICFRHQIQDIGAASD